MPKQPQLCKIAVVDDNPDFLEAMKLLLEQTQDLECAGLYASAESALKEIPRAPPDLVLLDIRMTGMDGLECAGRLKIILPKLKIVICSGFVDKDYAWQASRLGAKGYLVKGFSAAELREAIQFILDGGTYLSPSVQQELVAAIESFHARMDGLSPRERQVLQFIFQEKSDKEIAAELKISPRTVQTHERSIYKKLKVHSRADAIAKFLYRP